LHYQKFLAIVLTFAICVIQFYDGECIASVDQSFSRRLIVVIGTPRSR